MINDYKSKFLEASAQSDRNFARYKKRKAQSDKNFARYEREKKRAEKNEICIIKLNAGINSLQSKLADELIGTNNDFSDDRTSLIILGLQKGYTKEELKKVYARLVNRYHPDKHMHMPASFITLAEIEFKKIKLAYEKLK